MLIISPSCFFPSNVQSGLSLNPSVANEARSSRVLIGPNPQQIPVARRRWSSWHCSQNFLLGQPGRPPETSVVPRRHPSSLVLSKTRPASLNYRRSDCWSFVVLWASGLRLLLKTRISSKFINCCFRKRRQSWEIVKNLQTSV